MYVSPFYRFRNLGSERLTTQGTYMAVINKPHSAILKTTSSDFREATHIPGRWPHLRSPSHLLPSGHIDVLALPQTCPTCPCRQALALAIPKVLKGLPQILTFPYFPSLLKPHLLREASLATHTQSAQLLTQLDYLALSTTWQAIHLLFFFFYILTFQLIISFHCNVISRRLHCSLCYYQSLEQHLVHSKHLIVCVEWCFLIYVQLEENRKHLRS